MTNAPTFELVRNANVEISQVKNKNGNHIAIATIDGRYQHRFPASSRVSKHLELMTADDLSQRLSGGHYFFVEDDLVNFRDSSYGDGFVHDDNTIEQFVNHLGIHEIESRSHDITAPRLWSTKKQWSESTIDVPGYKQGTTFDARLSFEWDPFVKTINSSFELVRLICSNGMVGLTPILNAKVPLMNRWEEHLTISSIQIQNKIESLVTARVHEMIKQRASVSTCLLLQNHADERLKSDAIRDNNERRRLLNLRHIADSRIHLGNVYRDRLFEDKNLASQMPSHLSMFDVYNITTEMRTHTNACSKSSDFALDRMANTLLFSEDTNFSVGVLSASHTSAFADPSQAFFGNVL
jgi:hypothetical protein